MLLQCCLLIMIRILKDMNKQHQILCIRKKKKKKKIKKKQRNEYNDDKSGGKAFAVGIGEKKDLKKKGKSQTQLPQLWNKTKEDIINLNKSMNLLKSKILLSCRILTTNL